MSSASRSIGIIGVGRMGRPIAERLAGAGFDVAVYDADADRRRAAADRGLTVVRGAAALAARSDVLVTVLPGAPEFADVMATGGDVATSLRPGSVWLDLTSNDPRVATAVLAAGRTGGVEGVGAPIGGGPADARAGTLSFFVGGAPAAVGRVMPVLDAIGRDGGIRLVGGDIAHGYLLKLLVNALWFGQVAATAEAYLVAESLGLSRRDFAAGLAGTAAQSAFTDVYLPRLIDGDVVADFGLSGCRDELAVVQGIARHAGIPTAVLDAVTRLHADALARFGAIDGEMLVARHIELAAGGQPPV
ncbi:NAD(P)-dependent oxidoreductase [Microbacterium sp.]|uniref:NAD(P)-dependent oxidoreductase n=1 Tax=Microbacterium sp. TaxID=51671 RepID=UPI00289755BF|nr:NAD(P)-dependent oxidoreductase [Microbacterium sp.]